MRHSARAEFLAVYGSNRGNFMTPHVIRYGRKGKRVYELSWGESIFDREKKLFGVTLIDSIEKIKLHDESKCFGSLVEAERFIAAL